MPLGSATLVSEGMPKWWGQASEQTCISVLS